MSFSDFLKFAVNALEDKDALSANLGKDDEVWAKGRVDEMVAIVPAEMRDQARSLLLAFAEQCFARGAASAIASLKSS